MGAERDPTGEAGAGLSDTPAGGEGLPRRDVAEPAPRGTGEVHGGLHAGGPGGSGADRYGALSFAEGEGGPAREEGMRERAAGTATDVRERAGEAASQARDRAREWGGQARDRAEELASRARERAGDALSRAERELEERGVLERIRENPLPALGIAFGVGFLLAGSGGEPKNRTLAKAKNQLKGAVMGGLSAAIAQEARSVLGIAGSGGRDRDGGLLQSLIGSQGGRGSR